VICGGTGSVVGMKAAETASSFPEENLLCSLPPLFQSHFHRLGGFLAYLFDCLQLVPNYQPKKSVRKK
jgi:hypothetical protein